MLREMILRYSDKRVFVGVLGYPNTGKSSIINALKGKRSASTSSESGHTKGLQKIRVDNRITIIDSPGVYPFQEKDEVKQILLGTRLEKDPEYAAEILIDNTEGIIEKYYGVNAGDGLEKIAVKLSMIAKGGIPDMVRAGRKVIHDWKKGNISF